MPTVEGMAYIDIDVDDYLDDATASALHKEIERRMELGEWVQSKAEKAYVQKEEEEYQMYIASGLQPWSPNGLAADLREAFYHRDASRLEMLLTVLERHEAVA